MGCAEASQLGGIFDHSGQADDDQLLAIERGVFGVAVVDVAAQGAIEVDLGGVGEDFRVLRGRFLDFGKGISKREVEMRSLAEWRGKL